MFTSARAISSLISMLVMVLSLTGAAATPTPLEKGKLLVATHQLDETPYRHAVILVTEHSDKGLFGLTINRPTPVFIDEFLPNTALREMPSSRLFMGGPNAKQVLFVVARATQVAQLHHLAGDLYYGVGRDAATVLTQSPANSQNVRAYAGYLNWPPGEIDAAIAKGEWRVMPADAQTLFNSDPDSLWEQMMGAWDGQWM
ncbi:MAG: YqgE/AlgH family protein [Pseudomonadota bacterium]